MRYGWIIFCLSVLMLSGCASRDRPESLAAGTLKQAEPLPFPRYLLPDGFELGPYGPIPGTSSYAIELKGPSSLKIAAQIYEKVLVSNYWKIEEVDSQRRSVWMKASKPKGALEVRGVQGAGVTSLFLIYAGNEGKKK